MEGERSVTGQPVRLSAWALAGTGLLWASGPQCSHSSFHWVRCSDQLPVKEEMLKPQGDKQPPFLHRANAPVTLPVPISCTSSTDQDQSLIQKKMIIIMQPLVSG